MGFTAVSLGSSDQVNPLFVSWSWLLQQSFKNMVTGYAVEYTGISTVQCGNAQQGARSSGRRDHL